MEILGFMAIMLCNAILVQTVVMLLRDPVLVNILSSYAPLISSNAEALTYTAAIILTVGLAYFPLKIKLQGADAGDSKMLTIGQVTLATLCVLSVSYLAGIIFIAAGTI